MKRMPLVYVAGPITVGRPTVMHNVASSVAVFEYLTAYGVAAFCPQWSALVAFTLPGVDYEAWMKFDFELVHRCDALVRLPGESKGADREVSLAKELDLPVFEGETWEDACQKCVEWYQDLKHAYSKAGRA